MGKICFYRYLFFTFMLGLNSLLIPAQENNLPGDTLAPLPQQRTIPVIEYSFQPRRLILPASLITVGAIGTAIDGMNDFHLFKRNKRDKQIRIDDYLEWGMLGWVFVCDLIGEEKHHFTDQFFILLLAEGFNAGMVRGLKKWVNEPRPDGGPHSFPSGHTSNVFLGAHLAYKEFKDTNMWLACSGYAVGAFVGFTRIYNNRHWLADVIAGAGFGILSVELAYLVYFPLRNAIVKKINKNRENKWMVAPAVTPYGGGLSLVYTF
ncbi:MAG: phosphatase PAP2 family protein [Tannerellaceae bacterium]|nr:phosphatase PAP2 family protein [Tannerellaceae bacterium]